MAPHRGTRVGKRGRRTFELSAGDDTHHGRCSEYIKDRSRRNAEQSRARNGAFRITHVPCGHRGGFQTEIGKHDQWGYGGAGGEERFSTRVEHGEVFTPYPQQADAGNRQERDQLGEGGDGLEDTGFLYSEEVDENDQPDDAERHGNGDGTAMT